MSILDNFDVVGVPRTFSIAEVRILKNRISFNLATASEIGYPPFVRLFISRDKTQNFSQKELHGKSCNSIQDMLWKERGINWNDFPVDCKRGSVCYKTKVKETAPLLNDKGDTEMVEVVRNRWVIDREPPIFSQEREYVEKWI